MKAIVAIINVIIVQRQTSDRKQHIKKTCKVRIKLAKPSRTFQNFRYRRTEAMRVCQSVHGQKHSFPHGTVGLPRLRRNPWPCNTRSPTIQGAATINRPGDTVSAGQPSNPPQVRRTTLQGLDDWQDLITDQDQDSKPEHIDENLRGTLIKYGELTQICYDSFYGDERDRSTFGESD